MDRGAWRAAVHGVAMSALFSTLIQQFQLISISGTVMVGGDSLMTIRETLSPWCP